jgi:hypothetical protein
MTPFANSHQVYQNGTDVTRMNESSGIIWDCYIVVDSIETCIKSLIQILIII